MHGIESKFVEQSRGTRAGAERAATGGAFGRRLEHGGLEEAKLHVAVAPFFFSKFDVYEMFRSRGIWFPPERRAKLKDQMQSGNLYLFTPHHRLGFSGLFSFRFSSHPLEVFLRFQPAAGIPPVLCIHPDTGFYFVCSGHAAVSAWLSTSGTSLAVQLRLQNGCCSSSITASD